MSKMKVDEIVKCPYCGDVSDHTFYINSDTLICNNPDCDKEFNISLKTEVVVTASIPKVTCIACDNDFDENEKNCPTCGYINGELNSKAY